MNTPDSNRPDNRLEQRARTLYHEAARHLDPTTAGRLRAVRREVLAGAGARQHLHRPHHLARWLIPSGACAMIALAALLVWPSAPRPAEMVPTAVTTADAGGEADNALPPDPEQADPNLYQNLDFYGWLAANDSQPTTH